MKRPIVIEFSGLPNSGKTTLLQNIKKMCECNNISAIIQQEPAELLPEIIPKGSIAQNLWITLETLQKVLELKFVKNTDFILLDRGFYNQLFWATMYASKDPNYSDYVINFMNKFDEIYNVRPNYLYVVDCNVDESIRRRMLSGEPVTFSKKEFLINYRSSFKKFIEKIDSKLYIDSSNLTKEEVADIVFKQIITL